MDFDVHQHLDFGTDIDKYADAMRKLKVRAAVSSLGPPFTHPGNDATEELFKKHGDVVVGLAYVPLDHATPKTVADFRKRGFRGLKCIIPQKRYDDEKYWPIYRKAEELKMPILFHTGVMARTEEFAARYPHIPAMRNVDHTVAHVSCLNMAPETLDLIARKFQNLTIIMAHYGSWGARDNASRVLLWNPNIYGDLTEWGWHEYPKFTKRAVELFRSFSNHRTWGQLVWGTDNPTSRGGTNIPMFRKSWKHIAQGLGIPKPIRERITGGTMEEIFGLN
jgi:hypothetical protein